MRYVIVLLALAGMVVSGLALKVHYDTGSEPCSINDKWDCGVVNHSPYAVFHGVPVAAIGIAGYLLIAVLGFLRRPGWLLLAVLVGLGVLPLSHQYRGPRSGGVVFVLRHLAGHHRCADDPDAHLAGMDEVSRRRFDGKRTNRNRGVIARFAQVRINCWCAVSCT